MKRKNLFLSIKGSVTPFHNEEAALIFSLNDVTLSVVMCF